MAKFTHLGTTVKRRHFILEEIEGRLNSGNACYNSVQNLLSPCLLPKSIKIKTCKTVILYGYQTWFLTLRGKTLTEGI
jgi:hypothetical protein